MVRPVASARRRAARRRRRRGGAPAGRRRRAAGARARARSARSRRRSSSRSRAGAGCRRRPRPRAPGRWRGRAAPGRSRRRCRAPGRRRARAGPAARRGRSRRCAASASAARPASKSAGVEAGEAEHHRPVGGVALAGEGEAAVQPAAEPRRRAGARDAVGARAQRVEEAAGGQHRPDRVRRRRPDADLEDVEDAEEHGRALEPDAAGVVSRNATRGAVRRRQFGFRRPRQCAYNAAHSRRRCHAMSLSSRRSRQARRRGPRARDGRGRHDARPRHRLDRRLVRAAAVRAHARRGADG